MRKFLVLALTALGGIASAQPGPQPTPPADQSMTSTDTPEPQPEPQPQPQPQPQPTVAVATVDSDRPTGTSIGLGLGYSLPTSLETPNRTSARLRLASGLTFEPALTIANSRVSMETANPPLPPTDTTDKITEVGAALLLRIPFFSRGRVDLEGLGTAGFTTIKNNPEGSNNTINTTTFSVGWGVGIGYWLSQHWQLSMSVTNPLVQYARRSVEVSDTTDSETTIGAIFVPQVTAMIHLYN